MQFNSKINQNLMKKNIKMKVNLQKIKIQEILQIQDLITIALLLLFIFIEKKVGIK